MKIIFLLVLLTLLCATVYSSARMINYIDKTVNDTITNPSKNIFINNSKKKHYRRSVKEYIKITADSIKNDDTGKICGKIPISKTNKETYADLLKKDCKANEKEVKKLFQDIELDTKPTCDELRNNRLGILNNTLLCYKGKVLNEGLGMIVNGRKIFYDVIEVKKGKYSCAIVCYEDGRIEKWDIENMFEEY